jgi:hypothetical protein
VRIKEIDVWVPDHLLNGIEQPCHIYERFETYHAQLKAKLIIEIPEKKIEITESEFDEICKQARAMNSRGKLSQLELNPLMGF